MTVTVTSALAGPATARYSNVYGALVDLGVLSGLGAQDVTGSGDPVAPILNAAGFYAPLTHSLILTRGTGDPTFTRATSAWEFDNEGKLITVPSGGSRFGGARMVRNLLAATSTLSTQNVTTVATSYTLSFYGTGSVTLSGTATGTLNGTGASNRVQTTVTATAGTLTLTVSGSVTDAQLENVTGQADQTASEYVSVGVLSAPYHGAGVDGVKWFNTNKDLSAISEANLLGYHVEGARTNSLLYSRDLSRQYWIGSVVGSELITNGDFASDLSSWSVGSGTATWVSGTAQLEGNVGTTGRIFQALTLTAGTEYLMTATITALSGAGSGGGIEVIGGSTVEVLATGTYTIKFTGTGAVQYIQVRTKNSGVGQIVIFDNISVKEAAIQVTTCTGIDNAANSASTLTAGAADATILQTLSLVAAARSFSAYVKRRTGTGTIKITRTGADETADVVVNGDFDTDSDWTKGSGWTISGGTLNAPHAPASQTTTVQACLTAGRTYTIEMDVTSVTPGVGYCTRWVAESQITFTTYPSGADPVYCNKVGHYVATFTATGSNLTIIQAAGHDGSSIDNIVIKPVINWTDITSQINSSTWTRVKIENSSVTNPSIGFKIATSGDAIDVDVCQDEAGASISSPIITTTAAVTRNADAETFQTASNWSDTAGWALATVQGESWANATGTAIGNGTNGLKLSASNSGIVAYDGTNTVNGPAGAPSGAEKLAMTWGSGALQAASGGVAGSAGSYDGAWGLATVGIGTSQGNVYIKDVYIGQSALTAAQLVQVTA